MPATLTMVRVCHLLYFHFLLFLILTGPSLGCGRGRGEYTRRRNRKMTPLVFKQHVPNVSERNLGASGVAEGAIARDNPKFKDLVANSNEDIVFKDEEGTGADRIMTQRCNEKLNRLAIIVMNTWPNVKLRVTEAWDEESNHQHAKDSLHYEGRAVDITTTDMDRSKYGYLARLAVEAGFDWVYYMSRGHIHCSVKSESSITTPNGGCFPGHSKVYLEGGTQIAMSQLKVGDRVLTMDQHGNLEYSEVIIFMDRDVHKNSTFISIETDSGRTIKLTSVHLIPVANSDQVLPEDMRPTFAEKVEVGHFVSVRDTRGHITVSKVTKVTLTRHVGVYAPLTTSGTIVVDNVLASCYGVVESQTLAHAAFVPLRTAHYVSSYFRRKPSSTTMEQTGIHWYAGFLYKIAPYVLNKDVLPSS